MNDDDVVIGPVCDVCKRSTTSVISIFVKRERLGKFEMVKIHLCAMHFLERLENDIASSLPEPPPPPNDDEEAFRRWEEENPDNDDDYEDDEDEEEKKGTNDRLRRK